jgi:hypothetical protein
MACVAFAGTSQLGAFVSPRCKGSWPCAATGVSSHPSRKGQAGFEPTGSRRDAASVIFNLAGYRVIDAVDLPLGDSGVKVQPADIEQGSRVQVSWDMRFRQSVELGHSSCASRG